MRFERHPLPFIRHAGMKYTEDTRATPAPFVSLMQQRVEVEFPRLAPVDFALLNKKISFQRSERKVWRLLQLRI